MDVPYGYKQYGIIYMKTLAPHSADIAQLTRTDNQLSLCAATVLNHRETIRAIYLLVLCLSQRN